MNHYATPAFWFHYRALPAEIRSLADRAYAHLKADPRYPPVHLKQVGEFWSARVGLHHRVVGVSVPEGISWFWIGTHADYDNSSVNNPIEPTWSLVVTGFAHMKR